MQGFAIINQHPGDQYIAVWATNRTSSQRAAHVHAVVIEDAEEVVLRHPVPVLQVERLSRSRAKDFAASKHGGIEVANHEHVGALRHHYASVLLEAGESVVAVAERLGHENANLVLSTYGHLMPNSEERTRKAVDEAWMQRPDGLETASES